jgi:hypothetical protein
MIIVLHIGACVFKLVCIDINAEATFDKTLLNHGLF